MLIKSLRISKEKQKVEQGNKKKAKNKTKPTTFLFYKYLRYISTFVISFQKLNLKNKNKKKTGRVFFSYSVVYFCLYTSIHTISESLHLLLSFFQFFNYYFRKIIFYFSFIHKYLFQVIIIFLL